jgi:hypothetical protein
MVRLHPNKTALITDFFIVDFLLFLSQQLFGYLRRAIPEGVYANRKLLLKMSALRRQEAASDPLLQLSLCDKKGDLQTRGFYGALRYRNPRRDDH